jgi:hypothetical protein
MLDILADHIHDEIIDFYLLRLSAHAVFIPV